MPSRSLAILIFFEDKNFVDSDLDFVSLEGPGGRSGNDVSAQIETTVVARAKERSRLFIIADGASEVSANRRKGPELSFGRVDEKSRRRAKSEQLG